MKCANKIFFALSLSLVLSSCGADKLNRKNQTASNTSFVSAECQMNSFYSPVCGKLNGALKDFDNTDIASCMQATDITHGHCDCHSNPTPVCGNDGQNHSECEARQQNIPIVKYVPCSATEI